jgi:hypothetical protein
MRASFILSLVFISVASAGRLPKANEYATGDWYVNIVPYVDSKPGPCIVALLIALSVGEGNVT